MAVRPPKTRRARRAVPRCLRGARHGEEDSPRHAARPPNRLRRAAAAGTDSALGDPWPLHPADNQGAFEGYLWQVPGGRGCLVLVRFLVLQQRGSAAAAQQRRSRGARGPAASVPPPCARPPNT